MVVAKCSEKLTVSKQGAMKFELESFNLWKLNELGFMKEYQIEIANRFEDLCFK